jgi:hypothetical protein
MNTQNVAGYPLGKIMRSMIPQAAEQQGMPVYSYHQEIALSSFRAFHDCLYFVPFDKFRRHRKANIAACCCTVAYT